MKTVFNKSWFTVTTEMPKMPNDYEQAREWAMARIGQRVFRCANGCSCDVCKGIEDKGLVIMDTMHATYITDCAFEMGFRYADSKEEL
ncbi:MAG TPA: hypothetical protein PLP28_12160 [Flavobacteriales bacterium]|nr:hypothetical protein [Flavobacteriales bacterium]